MASITYLVRKFPFTYLNRRIVTNMQVHINNKFPGTFSLDTNTDPDNDNLIWHIDMNELIQIPKDTSVKIKSFIDGYIIAMENM